jgi:regulator of cell morphogenesis and NO signaling
MNLSNQLLGEIVARDFRSASILSEAGIDFCCGGKKILDSACREKGINTEEIVQKLENLEFQPQAPGQNFNDWALDFLCDYIVNTHHSYVKKTLPDLITFTKKIAGVHGEHHPELLEIEEMFAIIGTELVQHLKKEEEVLFPAIKEALKTGSREAVQTIESEIKRMDGEHEFVGGSMDKINEISNHYTVPAEGCSTYQVTYRLLKQFEDDLHIHVHLENNILYKKALKIS